jgi:hypothetical protein
MKRIACLVLLVAGCTDTKPCPVYAYGAADIAAQQLRDPTTGQCETFNNNYPPCDNQCGPCPGVAAGEAQPANPDWGSCYGVCSSLMEADCLANASCHAAYLDEGSALAPAFWQCWDLPPTGAITGSCAGADAQTCSEHTDCFSLFTTGQSTYESCQQEAVPAACSTLTTEAACKARTDCDPIYIGMNCTCDPSGCMCATETYDHCQSH